MIRPATVEDISTITALGERFHTEAQWGDVFAYSAEDCAKSLTALIARDDFICLVADEGGVVGMTAGVLSPVYFNHAHVSGEELFWWVSDDASQMAGIRLLSALEAEAKARGCHSFQMKSIARLNGDRMAKVYAHRGYRPSEHTFIKRF